MGSGFTGAQGFSKLCFWGRALVPLNIRERRVMASRQELLSTLNFYQQTWCTSRSAYQLRNESFERDTLNLFFKFIRENPHCFNRSNIPGHVTGSALVLNPDLTRVLLTHHKKLGMWLQLGGHADGHPVTHEVAMTEAAEESGLNDLRFWGYEGDLFGRPQSGVPLPFDLDRHLIPTNSKDPEHFHYDVRYLVVAASEQLPVVSEESHDVRWFTFEQARAVTQEASMLRQFSKVEWIKKSLGL